jgi:hypothetical protein
MKNFLCCLLAVAVLMTFAGTAHAQIMWGTPQSITGPSDISTAGKYIDAIGINDFGSSPYVDVNGAITIGDTTFNPFFSNSGIVPSGPIAGGTDGSHSNASAYLSVLNGVAFSGFSPTPVSGTITFNGLTSGLYYQVQVWNPGGRFTDIVGGNTATLSDQYVLGTFLASGTSESFTFNAVTLGDAGEISAVSLRDVPEPSAYALMFAGLAVLGYCIRRKRARNE